MARTASSKKAGTSLEGTPKKGEKVKPSGHKGGTGTSHAEGRRSSSAGSGSAGSTGQRSTNR